MLLESILKKIFGDPNAKELKNIQVIVDKINALEPEMQALSSANLAAKTGEFKLRLAKGETLDDKFEKMTGAKRTTFRVISAVIFLLLIALAVFGTDAIMNLIKGFFG